MDSTKFFQEEKELLDAQANIWKHNYNFLSTIALKCAIKLGILDTIHMHGMPMNINELSTSLSIHHNKIPSFNRLMHLLVSLDFFTIIPLNSEEQEEKEKEGFGLTLSSQLLLKNHPLTQVPFVEGTSLQLEGGTYSPQLLCDWFKNDVESPFFNAHGRNFWEYACYDGKFNNNFNKAMESDSRFVTYFLVNNKEFKGLFKEIYSLVDVGGGNGTTSKAICEACPWLKCIVFDLPHVIQGFKEDVDNVNYVAGDMFEVIPNADIVLLKWILHDWGDDDCMKILKRCKEAISNRHGGGKVIIIDMVIEKQHAKSKSVSTQLLFDMQMMLLFGHGKERTKKEWEKLFIKAGFKNHEFHPILGLRSVIMLYPL